MLIHEQDPTLFHRLDDPKIWPGFWLGRISVHGTFLDHVHLRIVANQGFDIDPNQFLSVWQKVDAPCLLNHIIHNGLLS